MTAIIQDATVDGRVALWRRDPWVFCSDVFPKKHWPTYAQCEILDSVYSNKQTVVKGHRGWGKSRCAAYAALWFHVTHPGALTMTLAPIWAQSVESVWVEIRQLWACSKLPLMFPSWRCLMTELHTDDPKWRILSAAASDVANIEGRHADRESPALVISDESKKIEDAFRNSLEGMLANPESRFLGISTPGIPFGWFFDAFGKDSKYYATFSYRADQSPDPNVRAQAAKMARVLGVNDPTYRQQWLAEFCGADEGAIIQLSLIEPAIQRVFDAKSTFRKIMSLDPAGEGRDHSVLSYRYGPALVGLQDWQGWDILRSEKRVIDAAREWHPELLVIDEGGLGQGTVAHVRAALKSIGIPVYGYVSGARARDNERYANRKAEDVFALRDRFREGAVEVAAIKEEFQQRAVELKNQPEVLATMKRDAEHRLRNGYGISIPRNNILIGQLCSWIADERGPRTRVIDPKDSPDHADSALMAFSVDRVPMPMKAHGGANRII